MTYDLQSLTTIK